MMLRTIYKSYSKRSLNCMLVNRTYANGMECMNVTMDGVDVTENHKATEMNTIKEKTTEILEPPGKKVFYNPVQEFNRDLSVLVLQCFSRQFQDKNNDCSNEGSQKPFKILEALSATGLRSIRYAKEVPNVTEVIANDFASEAFENIKANIKYNNVEDIVKPSLSDAAALMFSHIHPTKRFQVVDIDPYGSPSQFLDSAVQCVDDGGMLCVTCTDKSVLCGNFPETCYAKYGALSLKCQGKHEMGLRIVLQCIQAHAFRYKRYIVPVLSISADFYIRLFVKLYTSAAACKAGISKISMVYHCCDCGATVLQPLGVAKKTGYALPHIPNIGGKCTHCGGAQQMGGPIWNGPLHDNDFVAELIESKELKEFGTCKRILGMLSVIQEELYDIPLYYLTPCFTKVLKMSQIPIITLRSAILNAGYRVSDSHCAKYSVKTDAPISFIWDVHKTWLKDPARQARVVPGSPGDTILSSPIESKVDFTERADANPASREMRLCRYQINPTPYWGPGSRSTTRTLEELARRKQETKERLGEENHEDAKKHKLEESS